MSPPDKRRFGATRHLGLVATVTGLLIAILCLLAPTSSASPLLHPQTRVAAITEPNGQFVGPHDSVLAVQGRERAPNYDRNATGSSVAAEGGDAGGGFWQSIKDQWAARDDTGAIRPGGGANDAPSWVAREAGLPLPGETAQQYATRILDEKYGAGNWAKGGGSEFSKIVKWVTRGGRLS